jgi:hypothetical protein
MTRERFFVALVAEELPTCEGEETVCPPIFFPEDAVTFGTQGGLVLLGVVRWKHSDELKLASGGEVSADHAFLTPTVSVADHSVLVFVGHGLKRLTSRNAAVPAGEDACGPCVLVRRSGPALWSDVWSGVLVHRSVVASLPQEMSTDA